MRNIKTAVAAIALIIFALFTPGLASAKSGKVIKVQSYEQFDNLMESEELLLIVYWSLGVRDASKIATKLAKDYEGIITVAWVNCDNYSGICDRQGVTLIPFFILYEDGEFVSNHYGLDKYKVIVDDLRLEDYVEYE